MILTIRAILISAINIFLGVISFFIGLRIILALFGANPATPIVNWIYNISGTFVSPFSGIFPNLSIGIGILDFVALIALIVYMMIGYFIISLIAAAMPKRSIVVE